MPKRLVTRVSYQEAEDPLEWRKELAEVTSILHLCVECGDFRKFLFKSKTSKWIYLTCPNCQSVLKIPRKRCGIDTN